MQNCVSFQMMYTLLGFRNKFWQDGGQKLHQGQDGHLGYPVVVLFIHLFVCLLIPICLLYYIGRYAFVSVCLFGGLSFCLLPASLSGCLSSSCQFVCHITVSVQFMSLCLLVIYSQVFLFDISFVLC